MQMSIRTRIEQTGTFLLAEAVELLTTSGLRAVGEVQANDALIACDGVDMPVISCQAIISAVPTVTLPPLHSLSPVVVGPVVVGADTLLLCEHFLCAALFGQRLVAVRAGDLGGPVLHHDAGQLPQRLFRIETHMGAEITVGGYRCLTASEPLIGAPDIPGRRPSHVLDARGAAQLCQSGILYRARVAS